MEHRAATQIAERAERVPVTSEIPRHLLWDASAHRAFILEYQLSEHSGAQLHWFALHRDRCLIVLVCTHDQVRR